jgi:hypothetical protein
MSVEETIQSGFLSQGEVRRIVGDLEQSYPGVFSQDRVRVVGVDIPPAKILDNESDIVEPTGDFWRLKPGAYQIRFGFQFPEELRNAGVSPRLFWRSSNHRLGVGGGGFVADVSKEIESFPDYFFGGEIVGNYHVWNPHGVVVEVGANVAQVCFTKGTQANLVVSELLRPAQILEFNGAGTIGNERTILPNREKVAPVDGVWELKRDKPYLVEFRGRAALQSDELLVPSRHYGDELKNRGMIFLGQHSCLGDPGYKGRLGMLVVPIWDVGLSVDKGIARVAKHKVIPVGELSEYQGQWVGVDNGESDPAIEFRSIWDWPGLVGVEMPALKDLMIDSE